MQGLIYSQRSSRIPVAQKCVQIGDSLEQNRQTIPQSQHYIKEQHLVLVRPANDIHHDITLHLEDHDSVIIKDDVARLLRRFLQQSLLKALLVFEGWVWV